MHLALSLTRTVFSNCISPGKEDAGSRELVTFWLASKWGCFLTMSCHCLADLFSLVWFRLVSSHVIDAVKLPRENLN